MDQTPASDIAKPIFAVKYLLSPTIALACVLAFRWPIWTRVVLFAWYTHHLLQGMSIHTGEMWSDYSNGSTLGGDLFKTLYMLFLVDPIKDWRHKSDGEKPISERPWWQRIYWCVCAAMTARGVGWNYQVSGVPSPSKLNRSMFLCCTAVRVLASYVLLDVLQFLIQNEPFFNDPQPNSSMRSHNFPTQIFYMILCFGLPYGALRFYYYIGAFIAIASGYSSQEEWPDLFGSWFDAYSVRTLWGRTWHQTYRRQLDSIGKAVAHLLGASRGSPVFQMIRINIAFLVSGVMHAFSGYSIGQHFGVAFPFFIAQPLAIIFEMFFASTTKKYTTSIPFYVRRCIGYTWTLVWFTYSASWYIDPIAQAGFGKNDIVSFSVVRFVLERFIRGS
ncbi:membrane bound O-acyl transferase family-domain-containing protein [Rhodocollybia butyracea]|uniref:Membrane bound O-acyl transferase family-domain-containing protein n=1 Tax=Rhodocollybia butyracea TaxID=206335 RepID=A0A9P5U5Z8_9AGAR|nr:membrane bound O-acyl transferase family-domain-containing protein [Rhodocollybia butyracea]